MNTRQLECFINVADSLNFSVAAERLFVTQPTVTNQIHTLESELEVKLFERSKKGVILTAAGEIFYKDAQEILMRENIAKTRVLNTQKRFSTKIAIAIDANAAEIKYLPAFISEFHSKHEDIYLFIQKFKYKIGIQNIIDRKMDILLYNTREVLDNREIVTHELFRGKFVAVFHKDLQLAKKKILTIEDLKQQYIILPEKVVSKIEIQDLTNFFQSASASVFIHFCDDTEVAHILAEGKLGIAILPDFEVLPNNNIVTVPLDIPENLNYIPYGIAWNVKETQKAILEFSNQLIQYFKQLY